MSETFVPAVFASRDEPLGTVVVCTYYGFKLPISSACLHLSAQWNVVDFPLYRFRNDFHDKTPTYLNMLVDVCNSVSANAIVFWYHGIGADEMATIKQKVNENVKLVIYNWDDPFTWRDPNGTVPKIAKYLNGALTSCTSVCKLYEKAATDNNQTCMAQYCLPGFDQTLAEKAVNEIHGKERFECDVVFIGTNLYRNEKVYPNQKIKRHELVEALYNMHLKREIKLHVYGQDVMKMFAESYQGFVAYEKQYEVMRKARIVISTHVVSDATVGGYVNERVCVGMGTGALIATELKPVLHHSDTVSEEPTEPYYVDLGDSVADAIGAIRETLNRPFEECESMRERARQWALQTITWEMWASRTSALLNAICDCVDVTQAKVVRNNYKRTMNVATTDRATSLPGNWVKADTTNDDLPNEHEIGKQVDECLQSTNQTTLVKHRQDRMEAIFETIQGENLDEGLTQLVNVAKENEHIDITNSLDEYWTRVDAFP